MANPQKLFDSERSARYDGVVSRLIEGYDAMLDTAAWSLRAWLPGKAKILVVGCGTGNDIVRLASIGPEWSFVGVDPSSHMISRAKDKVLEFGLKDRCELLVGSTESVKHRKFDGAVCLLVTHFYPTDGGRQAIFSSVADRLEEAAPFFVSELCVGRDRLKPWFSEAWKVGALERGIKATDLDRLVSALGTEVFPRTAVETEQLILESGFVRATQVFQSHAVFGWLAEKARQKVN